MSGGGVDGEPGLLATLAEEGIRVGMASPPPGPQHPHRSDAPATGGMASILGASGLSSERPPVTPVPAALGRSRGPSSAARGRFTPTPTRRAIRRRLEEDVGTPVAVLEERIRENRARQQSNFEQQQRLLQEIRSELMASPAVAEDGYGGRDRVRDASRDEANDLVEGLLGGGSKADGALTDVLAGEQDVLVLRDNLAEASAMRMDAEHSKLQMRRLRAELTTSQRFRDEAFELRAELASRDERVAVYEGEVASLRSAVGEKENEIVQLEQRFREHLLTIDEAQRSTEEQSANSIAKLRGENRTLRDRAESAESELERLRTELDINSKEAEHIKSSSQDDLRREATVKAALKTENQQLMAAQRRYEARVAELEQTVQSTSEGAAEQARLLSFHATERAALERQVAELQNKLDDANDKVQTQEGALKRVDELAAEVRRLEDAAAEHSAAGRDMIELQRQLEDSRQDLEQERSEVRKLRDRLAMATTTQQNLEAELTKLDAVRAELTATASALASERTRRGSAEDSYSRCASELSDAREAVRRLTQSQDAVDSDLHSDELALIGFMNSLERYVAEAHDDTAEPPAAPSVERMDGLESSTTALVRAVTSMHRHHHNLEQRLTNVGKANDDKEAKINKLVEEISHAQQSLSDAQSKVRESASLAKRDESDRQEYSRRIAELERRERELSTVLAGRYVALQRNLKRCLQDVAAAEAIEAATSAQVTAIASISFEADDIVDGGAFTSRADDEGHEPGADTSSELADVANLPWTELEDKLERATSRNSQIREHLGQRCSALARTLHRSEDQLTDTQAKVQMLEDQISEQRGELERAMEDSLSSVQQAAAVQHGALRVEIEEHTGKLSELDDRCSQQAAQLAGAERELEGVSDSRDRCFNAMLLLGRALLPALQRCSDLCSQKRLLARQVRKYELLSLGVEELSSVVGRGSVSHERHGPEPRSFSRRRRPSFRAAVIAVIAANRLVRFVLSGLAALGRPHSVTHPFTAPPFFMAPASRLQLGSPEAVPHVDPSVSVAAAEGDEATHGLSISTEPGLRPPSELHAPAATLSSRPASSRRRKSNHTAADTLIKLLSCVDPDATAQLVDLSESGSILRTLSARSRYRHVTGATAFDHVELVRHGILRLQSLCEEAKSGSEAALSAMADAVDRSSSLKSQLAANQSDLVGQQELVAFLESRVGQLTEELSNMVSKAQYGRLEKSLSEAKRQAAATQQQLAEANANCDDMRKEVNEKQAVIEQVTAETEAAQGLVAKGVARTREKTDEIGRLTALCRTREAAIEEQRALQRTAVDRAVAAEASLSDAEGQLRNFMSQLQVCHGHLEESRAEAARLRSALAGAVGRADSAESELKSFREQVRTHDISSSNPDDVVRHSVPEHHSDATDREWSRGASLDLHSEKARLIAEHHIALSELDRSLDMEPSPTAPAVTIFPRHPLANRSLDDRAVQHDSAGNALVSPSKPEVAAGGGSATLAIGRSHQSEDLEAYLAKLDARLRTKYGTEPSRRLTHSMLS